VSNLDEIISKALQLPEEKRTQVALRLLDSLDAPDPHAHLTDDELRAELDRRVKAVVDGTAEVIPADQAIEQLRAKLKK
jgi:putative addiction module component (TIGR02574 family)